LASILYRLGRLSYRRRGLVVLAWLFVLALAGAGAATLKGTTTDSFAIPGTESQQASELLAERLPQAGGDRASARIVFTTEGSANVTDPAAAAAITGVTAELTGRPHVVAVQDALTARQVARDQKTLLGDRAWWLPRWLERALPVVDVEGERLTRRLEAESGDDEPRRRPRLPGQRGGAEEHVPSRR
jgi:RND superfamily putative drug exporter